MAGIYIHIPFCKSRCIYCGFYSTVLHSMQDEYVDSLLKELMLRKDYLNSETVRTLYLGGGTPSVLSRANIEKLLTGILHSPLLTLDLHEVTMECNPDDVNENFARFIASCGVNRVSMGAQSFDNERLKFLGRRHNAEQVAKAVRCLREAGIQNISVDLMFGFPSQTLDEWRYDINKVLELNVEHISAYSLMYEEGTPLYRRLEKGQLKELDEETCREMYYTLIDMLETAGYEHYEISNFAKTGFRSNHNSSYWHNTTYLGLGAAAHSYDGKSRQWNISDVREYIKKVESGIVPCERELLSPEEHYNDMITTALRTREGISIKEAGRFADYMMDNARKLIDRKLLIQEGDNIRLTREGLYVSDDVMSDLIFI